MLKFRSKRVARHVVQAETLELDVSIKANSVIWEMTHTVPRANEEQIGIDGGPTDASDAVCGWIFEFNFCKLNA